MKAWVRSSNVNLRDSPNGNVIDSLEQFIEVQVQQAQGDWTQIMANSLQGFVASRYLIHKQTTEEGDDFLITTSKLNLRKAPEGEVITQLHQGDAVTVEAWEGDWAFVSTPFIHGFLSKKYLHPAEPEEAAPPITPGFRFDGKKAIAPDGTAFATKFKLGVFQAGKIRIADFLSSQPTLPGVSPSEIRIMTAVSPNEGCFESINTWDNSYLSAGIYQWTLGAQDSPGELAALLALLQKEEPQAFAEYFGQYGLGITLLDSPAHSLKRGYFSLQGKTLMNAQDKEAFRDLSWAYRFYKAGQDPRMQKVQVLHALSRVSCFYHAQFKISSQISLPQIITSEYGVALILDQHINRPGHLSLVLSQSLESLQGKLPADPTQWGDAEEQLLLQEYLQRRHLTSMTDSQKRAERVENALKTNQISAQRNSFKVNESL